MKRDDDLWVFGYGSLMWDPGFDFLDRVPALVHGYHRVFCVTSHRYRGTPERPGLVLGLDAGGSCRGLAYRVAADKAPEVMAYLDDREMMHHVYIPKTLKTRLPHGIVAAHTYVADRRHERYAGKLSPEATARYILQGRGDRGENRVYLEKTVAHLDALGLTEGPLHALRDLIREMAETHDNTR